MSFTCFFLSSLVEQVLFCFTKLFFFSFFLFTLTKRLELAHVDALLNVK